MNKKEKSIIKVLYQIHWAVNIAPKNNGVANRVTYGLDHWGERTNKNKPYRYATVISPTPPILSVNLVEIIQKLKNRYNKLINSSLFTIHKEK